jgi:beta-lactamase class A
VSKPADGRLGPAQDIIQRFCGDDPGRSVALAICGRDGRCGAPFTLHENGEVARPVASVIKVALVMALYDLAEAGQLSLDDQVPLSALGDTRYCSIMKAFDAGRSLSLQELAALALITSDNPVAVLLEERVGLTAVNRVISEAVAGVDAGPGSRVVMQVGFREDELGPRNRVNVMSALDVIGLFECLHSKPHYAPVAVALENNLRNARIPALLPDEAVIAHKTGSLNGVVNDAGTVRLNDAAFTVAFLTDGQADLAVTSNDIAACSLELFELLLNE